MDQHNMSVIAANDRKKSAPPDPREHQSLLGSEESAIGLLDALALVRRHLWLIGATIVGGTFAAALAAFTLPELFTASSSLVFERRDARLSEAATELEGSELNVTAVETEIDVIVSRLFVGRLIDSYELLNDPFFNSYLADVSNDDMDVSGSLLGVIREWLADFGISAGVNAERVPAQSVQHERAITSFISRLSVARPRESFAVSIQMTHRDAKRAADLANAVADAYVELSLERKKDAIGAAIVLLRNRITQLASRMAESEQKVANHIRDNQLDVSGRDYRRDDLLRAEIAQLKARLQLSKEQQLGSSALDAAPQINQIERNLATLERELQKLTLADIRRRALEQELITDRNRYNQLVERLVNLDSQAALQTPSARVISRAEMPTDPSSPKRKIIIAGGFLGSAMLAILLALLFDGLSTSIRTGERMMQIVGLPNLTYVPEAPQKLEGMTATPFQYLKKYPGSFFAEALRSLFTACRRVDLEHPPKVLMMTSALPAEGKSTIALGLATTTACLGYRTILVDLDLHRLGVGEAMGISEHEDRFSAYLVGEGDLSDVVPADSDVPGLDVLAAMPGAIQPSTLLSSNRLAEMLGAFRTKYDFVILDTPAALVVNDVSYLAPLVDAAILIVRWGHTTEKALRDTVVRLRMNQIPLIGTAINRVDPRAHARRGYGGSLAYYQQAQAYYSDYSQAYHSDYSE